MCSIWYNVLLVRGFIVPNIFLPKTRCDSIKISYFVKSTLTVLNVFLNTFTFFLNSFTILLLDISFFYRVFRSTWFSSIDVFSSLPLPLTVFCNARANLSSDLLKRTCYHDDPRYMYVCDTYTCKIPKIFQKNSGQEKRNQVEKLKRRKESKR